MIQKLLFSHNSDKNYPGTVLHSSLKCSKHCVSTDLESVKTPKWEHTVSKPTRDLSYITKTTDAHSLQSHHTFLLLHNIFSALFMNIILRLAP